MKTFLVHPFEVSSTQKLTKEFFTAGTVKFSEYYYYPLSSHFQLRFKKFNIM